MIEIWKKTEEIRQNSMKIGQIWLKFNEIQAKIDENNWNLENDC